MSDGEAYGGALGAFPYAVRASDSWAFRIYAVVAALVGLGTVAIFLLSLVGVVASTANQSASVTLARGFVLLVMLAVLVPTVAPVLLVARRHRLDLAVAPGYDRALAAAGLAFVAALYLGLVVSAPDRLVADRYRSLGAVPPLLAAATIPLLHRRLGRADGEAPPDEAATPDDPT